MQIEADHGSYGHQWQAWGRSEIWDQAQLELGELARLQTLTKVPRNIAIAPKLPDQSETVGETRQAGSSSCEVLGALSFGSGTPAVQCGVGRGRADAICHIGRLDLVQGLVQAGNGRERPEMVSGMLTQGCLGQHRDQKKYGRYDPLYTAFLKAIIKVSGEAGV